MIDTKILKTILIVFGLIGLGAVLALVLLVGLLEYLLP